jgi:hypothetical protein
MLTKQEIFDKVSTHLLRQNARSHFAYDTEYPYVKPSCAYRNEKGLKCAVGCLISDEAYTSEIENLNVLDEKVLDVLGLSGVDVKNEETMDMLCILQELHDWQEEGDWKYGLANIADSFCVTFSGLEASG